MNIILSVCIQCELFFMLVILVCLAGVKLISFYHEKDVDDFVNGKGKYKFLDEEEE